MSKTAIISGLILSLCLLLPENAVAKDDPLIMGVFPRRPAQVTIQAFKPLTEYLSKKLNREVKLETTYNFASFWEGVKNKKYDIVHFNQYHYVRSHKEYGYNVIVMNEEFGKSTISSIILAKKDSGIRHLKDIRGKTFAFGGGPKAMVSYILPIMTLQNADIATHEYKTVFAKNPPNAVMAVYFDKADLAGVGNRILEMPAVTKHINISNLIKIAESESIVQLPWAVKNTMPMALSLEIQKIFTSLNNSKENKKILKSAKVTDFTIAEDADYDRTREIVLKVTGQLF